MRPVSSKRARILSRRRANVQDREHGRPACARQAICGNAADDLHEIVRRSQADSAARVDLQVWLCRGCHDWVGAHPAEAAAEGLHMTGADFRMGRQASDNGAIVTGMSDTPPSGDNRVTLRISDAGHAFVDALMVETSSDRSAVLRAMFAVASQYRAEVLARLSPDVEPEPFDSPARTARAPVLKPSQGGRG